MAASDVRVLSRRPQPRSHLPQPGNGRSTTSAPLTREDVHPAEGCPLPPDGTVNPFTLSGCKLTDWQLDSTPNAIATLQGTGRCDGHRPSRRLQL